MLRSVYIEKFVNFFHSTISCTYSYSRITDAIFNSITEYQATNYISVVATCTDIAKVGKKLREARGVHFFRTILTMANLEKVCNKEK